jgi:hypothetical protein
MPSYLGDMILSMIRDTRHEAPTHSQRTYANECGTRLTVLITLRGAHRVDRDVTRHGLPERIPTHA